LAIFGGDSDHFSWEIILNKTRKHENDVKEQALDWDLFLAPHHCSWSFFNDRPQADNPEPKASSLEVLDYKRSDGKVIASSKKIVDDEDNPPHYEAKIEYQKKVNKTNFLNTAIQPKEEQPEPIEFEIETGITRTDKGAKAELLRQLTNNINAGLIGTSKTGKLSDIEENVNKHQPHIFYGDE